MDETSAFLETHIKAQEFPELGQRPVIFYRENPQDFISLSDEALGIFTF